MPELMDLSGETAATKNSTASTRVQTNADLRPPVPDRPPAGGAGPGCRTDLPERRHDRWDQHSGLKKATRTTPAPWTGRSPWLLKDLSPRLAKNDAQVILRARSAARRSPSAARAALIINTPSASGWPAEARRAAPFPEKPTNGATNP